jgi:DNA-binding NarL/FixJ family response regulator
LKKIIILSKQSMFSQGIEKLLSFEEEFEIIDNQIELDSLVEAAQEMAADVIIVNCDDPEVGLTPTMGCVLRERLGICLIGLSLNDNKMCIYRGENKQILDVQDLVEAIRD